ncbi:spore coat protein [Paenibacillus ihbetae]|uniref:Spore coat protein n=1 Tax=Paenibacillus ihbetae TaxID=1870820 RepID=A0A1B2DXP1_9BACL|nr:spore coat protein [Paenibacillus ihbetae]ANY72452.1 spore coat protein [Paenibacillus ihbetae]OOC58361.1 spore coat protein [Paenibacillus ihbetae]
MDVRQPELAMHESMELHELLNFKTVCLAKSKMMQGLVFDQDLRALMQKDVEQSLQDIGELQSLYSQAPIQ